MLNSPYTSVAIAQQTLLFVSTKVTLKAAANTVPMGSIATLIATNTRDLVTGPYYAQTYDVDTGQRVGACGGATTCNVVVSNLHNYASTRKFITYVGLVSPTFPPPQAIAVSKPTWVTWSDGGYTIKLVPEVNSTSAPCGPSARATSTADGRGSGNVGASGRAG